VLGGMGNIPGVILGAVLLTVLPEALRYIGDAQRALLGHVAVDPADLRMLLFGVALILMMLFRPEGLLPSRRRQRELHPSSIPTLEREITSEPCWGHHSLAMTNGPHPFAMTERLTDREA
ncbi:MAG: hypothetical protein ACK44M_00960, partial [Chloroflexus sp.]